MEGPGRACLSCFAVKTQLCTVNSDWPLWEGDFEWLAPCLAGSEWFYVCVKSLMCNGDEHAEHLLESYGRICVCAVWKKDWTVRVELFLLLVHTPNDWNETLFQSPASVPGTKALGPVSDAFPGISAGIWIRSWIRRTVAWTWTSLVKDAGVVSDSLTRYTTTQPQPSDLCVQRRWVITCQGCRGRGKILHVHIHICAFVCVSVRAYCDWNRARHKTGPPLFISRHRRLHADPSQHI